MLDRRVGIGLKTVVFGGRDGGCSVVVKLGGISLLVEHECWVDAETLDGRLDDENVKILFFFLWVLCFDPAIESVIREIRELSIFECMISADEFCAFSCYVTRQNRICSISLGDTHKQYEPKLVLQYQEALLERKT